MLLRSVYIFVGVFSLGLAFIGVLLPLVPATPFLILSAFCFTRSSPRLSKWLHNQKYLSPYIRSWEQNGAIPKRAKILATAMMVISVSASLSVLPLPLFAIFAIIAICSAVLAYIWTRPSE